MISYNNIFIIILSFVLIFFMQIVFRKFTQEKYQFIAAVPIKKNGNVWKGINFTFYGFITASSIVLGISIFYLLMLMQSYPGIMIILVVAPILIVGILSAKFLAILIEKKKSVFSVGAAVFVSFLISPFVVYFVNNYLGSMLGIEIDFMYFMSAVSVSFLFGEGIGRLACISYGCCYGKPVGSLSPIWKRVFKKINFVFYGKTKKIAYASNYDEIPVVPIQAITSIVCNTIGVLGLYLLMNGYVFLSFLISSIWVFLWRFLSEFMRSDYRGGVKQVSLYQVFSLVSIVYAILIALISNHFFVINFKSYDLIVVLEKFWSANTLVILQLVWFFCFVYFGKSNMTTSKIEFAVKEELI